MPTQTERMDGSKELAELEDGDVIGYHYYSKSICNISSLVDVPPSAVSGVIPYWKCLGTTGTRTQSGTSCRVTERGHQLLRPIVHKSH